jgi:tetratricopeptide (TPR) repeat protein
VGQQPIAQKLLAALVKDAPMPAASLLLGDLAAGRGDWATAAAHYEQAADREPPDALATALWALALARRGDEKQGRELFISAQQMAMGDDGGPWSLAQGLAQRGHAEQAARQQELIILTGDPRSLDYYSALETRAREWTNAGDHDRAAHAFERSLLECLGSNMHFGQIASYLHVPAAIHRLRAMASLKEGQVAAALIHADKALAINPGDVDLAIEIVTRLDALKRPVQAQALFDRVYAFLAQIVKAWPDSGQQRNNLAWLSARCLRRLDEALEHAKAAVALESDSAAYLDTLAEVHFVRGDKAQAIRWIRKAIERDPANDYLQGQLRRFGG